MQKLETSLQDKLVAAKMVLKVVPKMVTKMVASVMRKVVAKTTSQLKREVGGFQKWPR